MIFLALFFFFYSSLILTLYLRSLLGTQWYLVFGLRHKKYFRSLQMSRVQLRGEPDPLYTAAGQRSVLNCQSSGRDTITAYLTLGMCYDVKVTRHRSCVFENDICFSVTKVHPHRLNCLLIPVLLNVLMVLLYSYKPSEQYNNHDYRVYTATYSPSPAAALTH